MEKQLREELIQITRERIKSDDPSHDIQHTLRVLANAEYIASKENGDFDVIVPGALFHDIVCYEKNDPRNRFSVKESADMAEQILRSIPSYPQEKIGKVRSAILSTSFSFGKETENLEDEIVQASDMLEAVGTIAIMRSFASAGSMKRSFYNEEDPFAEHRELDDMKYTLDLFYTRLLKINERIKTKTAKEIAERRTQVLVKFLEDFKTELQGI